MDFNEALQHAGIMPGEMEEEKGVRIPEGVRKAIRDKLPRYLWIIDNYERYEDTGWPDFETEKKLRRLHCEACEGDYVEERRGKRWVWTLGQNEEHACPMCGGRVTVKHVSRGFKNLDDRVDVVWYGKSAIDPEVIVAWAGHCTRYFWQADAEEPWTLDVSVSIRGAAAFRWGEGGVRVQSTPIWEYTGGRYEIAEIMWKRVKSMHALTFGVTGYGMMYNAPPQYLLEDTLAEAVRGTPFERAWHEAYAIRDGIAALDLIGRYPCCEYMTKLGMEVFVRERIHGRLESNLINWNGRSMAKVLRLTKARLGEIKGANVPMTPALLAIVQACDKLGVPCTAKVAASVAKLCAGTTVKARLTRVLELFQPSRRKKAMKYLAKWGGRIARLRLSDFEDYWAAVSNLGGNLDADDVAFPADFPAAHDRMVDRKNVAISPMIDAAIRKNVKKLTEKYGFEFGGLILRPAASTEEVLREGETLHHCVGTYVRSYAEGKTVICVLRRAVEPDKPWRTVEINKLGGLVQDRGFHNDWGEWNMIDEKYRAMLDLFWQAWKERGKVA